MDIETIRGRRQALQLVIKDAIIEFENDTTVEVKSIEIEKLDTTALGGPRSRLMSVHVTLEEI